VQPFEMQVMHMIRDACTQHLASKGTSPEQDVELLKAAQIEEDELLQLAISWRLCQKRSALPLLMHSHPRFATMF
jgi:hypothetical protein